jgi:hypothetical protein
MTANIANTAPFLRTAREFPTNVEKLTLQINKSWVDIANTVNARIIGLFSVNLSAITGEEWFLVQNQKQQTLRQVFTFTTFASITHNINITDSDQFTRCWGSYTEGTNSYGIIWGNLGGKIPNNVSFYLTSTQIIFQVDAGAIPIGANGSGRVILEWLSSP